MMIVSLVEKICVFLLLVDLLHHGNNNNINNNNNENTKTFHSSSSLFVSGLALPQSELTNRRKSPALWRNDLSEDKEENMMIITPHDQHYYQQKQLQKQMQQQHHDGLLQTTTTATTTSTFIATSPPEVMAPVGGWPQLYAAIGNGADSIYLGLSAFSARARASNFDPIDELPKAVQICHDAHVKVYVALNTLVFDNELQEVEQLIQNCISANVDALIVQDLGVTKLAQQIINNYYDNNNKSNGMPSPNQKRLEIHASTQQTITNADGAAFCEEVFQSNRVVLGRELSTVEIQNVASHLDPNIVELEVFVHGALCVSYSGQCFSSEAWGGRSANRGQCAQACRLPYGLIDNGSLKELGDFSYLLSPQDLCGIDHVPQLMESNAVRCLKIEGRLKDAAYVAATTRAYRNAVDQAWDAYCIKHNIQTTTTTTKQRRVLAEYEEITRNELAQVFSRGQDENHNGLTPGFFDGSKHQQLVRGRSPRHRGVHVGRVEEGSNFKNGLIITTATAKTTNNNNKKNHKKQNTRNDSSQQQQDSSSSLLSLLKPGDGIVVDRGMAQEEELGGAIYDIQHDVKNGRSIIFFSRDTHQKWKKYDDYARKAESVPFAPAGAHVWKTSDAIVDKKLKRLSEAPPPKTMVQILVSGNIGTPLTITINDNNNNNGGRLVGIGQSPGNLEPTEGSGLSEKNIIKAIGKLGNTQWVIDDPNEQIDMSALEDGAWCPVSWIKEARRLAVEDLESKLLETTRINNDNNNNDVDVDVDDDDDDDNDYESSLTFGGGGSGSVAAKMLERAYDEDNCVVELPKPKLSVLARNYEQVNKLCEMIENEMANDIANHNEKRRTKAKTIIDEIIVDFLEVDGMKEAVARIQKVAATAAASSAKPKRSIRTVVASPRIIKPGESGIWKTLLQLQPDGLLVRSTGLLYRMMKLGGPGAQIEIKNTINNNDDDDDNDDEQSMTENNKNNKIKVTVPELIGDFSLNVANALTAWELLDYGCSRVTTSYDLSANAITELLETLGEKSAQNIEVIAHTHLPIFHTEHCVFARFLTNGNSYVDCGHACTRHNVHLRDSSGMDNLVLADMGCRNTVFSAQAQSGVHSLKEWASVGAGRFRIELVDERPDDVELIVQGYLDVLNGQARPKDVWSTLDDVKDSNGRRGGVSHGSLRNKVERRAGEIV